MTSVISATPSSDYYATLFSGGGTTGSGTTAAWLNDAITAIQNSQNSGGILGALASTGDGSVDSFLGQSSSAANNLALISQNNVTSASAFYAQLASQNQQQQNADKLNKALQSLSETQKQVQAQNVNPLVYLPDGTTIDTVNNIMTRPDGTQYDTTTGAKYIDPASVIQMANGAYLNTTTNVLTLPDGSQIDTVTGLKVSTTA